MSDEARRLLAAVKREIDADAHLRCLLCHEEGGHCEGCPAPEIDAFLAQPEPAQTGAAAREAVLVEALKRCEELFTTIKNDFLDPRHECRQGWKIIDDALTDTSLAAVALLAQGEKMKVARGKVMMIDASPAGSLNAQLKAEALAALAPEEE